MNWFKKKSKTIAISLLATLGFGIAAANADASKLKDYKSHKNYNGTSQVENNNTSNNLYDDDMNNFNILKEKINNLDIIKTGFENLSSNIKNPNNFSSDLENLSETPIDDFLKIVDEIIEIKTKLNHKNTNSFISFRNQLDKLNNMNVNTNRIQGMDNLDKISYKRFYFLLKNKIITYNNSGIINIDGNDINFINLNMFMTYKYNIYLRTMNKLMGVILKLGKSSSANEFPISLDDL